MEEKYTYNSGSNIIHTKKDPSSLNDKSWDQLRKIWDNSEKVLIVGGQHKHDDDLLHSLQGFARKMKVPVVGDCISTLHGLEEHIITHHDLILNNLNKLKTLK